MPTLENVADRAEFWQRRHTSLSCELALLGDLLMSHHRSQTIHHISYLFL